MHVNRSKLELCSPQEEKKHKKRGPVQGLANACLQNLCCCLQNSAKHKQVFQTNNSILTTHFDITMVWSENITTPRFDGSSSSCPHHPCMFRHIHICHGPNMNIQYTDCSHPMMNWGNPFHRYSIPTPIYGGMTLPLWQNKPTLTKSVVHLLNPYCFAMPSTLFGKA